MGVGGWVGVTVADAGASGVCVGRIVGSGVGAGSGAFCRDVVVACGVGANVGVDVGVDVGGTGVFVAGSGINTVTVAARPVPARLVADTVKTYSPGCSPDAS